MSSISCVSFLFLPWRWDFSGRCRILSIMSVINRKELIAVPERQNGDIDDLIFDGEERVSER